jgi:hypothetical protein
MNNWRRKADICRLYLAICSAIVFQSWIRSRSCTFIEKKTKSRNQNTNSTYLFLALPIVLLLYPRYVQNGFLAAVMKVMILWLLAVVSGCGRLLRLDDAKPRRRRSLFVVIGPIGWVVAHSHAILAPHSHSFHLLSSNRDLAFVASAGPERIIPSS